MVFSQSLRVISSCATISYALLLCPPRRLITGSWGRSRWPLRLFEACYVVADDDKVLLPSCLRVFAYCTSWRRCTVGLSTQYTCMLPCTYRGSLPTNILFVCYSKKLVLHSGAFLFRASANCTVVCDGNFLNDSTREPAFTITSSIAYELKW